ncbi:scavenger receptor cysteine-rich type 1 protein M130-like [Scomber scombrus]|uniref:scavenger receptor cysteine-rich type 1 protein M130-like n=1 Tax=Scomber scombrus TaxID=13677 RepID=UPI002DD9DEBD|nr:scavenger receptor cysteine-rich type 1 protein M130-like [Scomber scombrus]
MDHLLMVLVLLCSSGLQAEDDHQSGKNRECMSCGLGTPLILQEELEDVTHTSISGSQCDSKAEADIVLFVGTSESVASEDFSNIKSFLTQVVSIFDIGPDKVQIGLVQYSDNRLIKWELNTHQTNQSLLEAITNLQQTGGATHTGEALKEILDKLFKPEQGMRADSKRIAVLITDGESEDDVVLPSQRLRDTGIEVYAIGVKEANKAQLRAIASDPDEIHMFNVSDFSVLRDIVGNFTINLCNSATNYSVEPVRLVGGASRCAGSLEVKHGEWRPVSSYILALKEGDVICRYLDCGSAVSTGNRKLDSYRSVWRISSDCVQSGSDLRDCASSSSSSYISELTCSDSVRLVNGTSLCSGRLEVKSEQSWSSVCEADFDQQDAEVVCRDLGCGAPLVLQGALYGEVEAPMWTKEFQCGGNESALLDCRRSDSARRTCSPGKAVGLTCSEPVRLVGGASRCAGSLEVKHGEWTPVSSYYWTLKEADVLCRYLDCGSTVATTSRKLDSTRSVRRINDACVPSGSYLRDCVFSDSSSSIVEITCSDSARLVNGTSLCSGRLEVKSEQSWSSVCEADFDQQDAEVVCRELDCGFPSVLQGALYGEVEAPMWTKEFQCGGNESALLDCRRSDSARRTCSPGKAVGLTCSEPVRLVGGTSRCAGTLELKYGEWKPVSSSDWTLEEADVICTYLDCGSAVATGGTNEDSLRFVWRISSDCLRSGSALSTCVSSVHTTSFMEITCSVQKQRLVNGTSLCSGRLEVKSEQSWSSVCEADFDQQDAEVVCRELGCGAPSVLQGALYGEVETPMWTKEFHCGGNESALLDCRRSDSARRTCSPGKAVGLTCSDPVRLVGGASRCAGSLEVKHIEWRPVSEKGQYQTFPDWTLKDADVVCRYLDCGSAVATGSRTLDSGIFVWRIISDCLHSGSALLDCVSTSDYSSSILEITCSDLLLQPIISVSPTMDGVSEAQQQGFQVLRSYNYTQPAVSHSADFLFPAADPAHQGNYSCVYGVYVFSHNFSSESRLLSLTVTGKLKQSVKLSPTETSH